MTESDPQQRAAALNLDETMAATAGKDTRADQVSDVTARLESLGRYQIEELLGRGGMGAVYLARDTQLDRKVALKIPSFGPNTDPNLMKRFYKEARSAANLSHPNLCPVFDVGEIDGTHYIAMAHIQGRTLERFVDPAKPPSQRAVASIVRKVALAMEDAHRSGIIHRDLKPANIMVDHRKEPIVMDFGLACPAEGGDETRLTQDGAILGSPAYMSPEQCSGKLEDITHQSDIYSLGVVLYELLSGKVPFHEAPSLIAMIGLILTQEPPKIQTLRDDLDPMLVAICEQAIAKNVAERYQSMREFADALGAYLKTSAKGKRTTSIDAMSELSSERISRIQLQEKERLARSLVESGQFTAARPLLEEICQVATHAEAPEDTWAREQLAEIDRQQQPDPLVSNQQPDDLFGELPSLPDHATTPLSSAPRSVGQPSSVKPKRGGTAFPLLSVGIVVAGVLVVGGLATGALYVWGPGDKSSTPAPSHALDSAASSEASDPAETRSPEQAVDADPRDWDVEPRPREFGGPAGPRDRGPRFPGPGQRPQGPRNLGPGGPGMGRGGPNLNSPRREGPNRNGKPGPDIQQQYKQLDQNRDGVLGLEEMPDHERQRWHRADTNNDQRVTLDEWTRSQAR